MSEAVPPIFIIDDLDVCIFASLREVELHLEPDYLEGEPRTIYDSNGRLVRVEVKGNRVIASLAEEKPTHAAELETSLRAFLSAMSEPLAGDPACKLPCLVGLSRSFMSTAPTVHGAIRSIWHKIAQAFRK